MCKSRYLLERKLSIIKKLTHDQLAITCSNSAIETLKKCEICSELTIKTPERRSRFTVTLIFFYATNV